MVIGLGWAYTHFGGLGWMQAVFYGVSSAVIGIIAISTWKLSTKNIGKDKLQWAIFAVAAAVTIITQSEELWLFLGAGVLVWLLRAPPNLLSRPARCTAVLFLCWPAWLVQRRLDQAVADHQVFLLRGQFCFW
jgi:chromate transport protein ChrA